MDERPPSADRVPTLTEVVELGPSLLQARAPEPASMESLQNPADLPDAPFEPLAMPDLSGLSVAPMEPSAPDAPSLTGEVLALLAPRIEALFETRLRETLAPALASAAEALIRDSRVALTQTLQAMVEEAVARALHKPRED